MAIPLTTTPDAAIGNPPRPRRSIPLSLRLFLAVLLMTGAAGALLLGSSAYRQHASIGEVHQVSGYVCPGSSILPEWKWLREFLGEEITISLDDIEKLRFYPREETFHKRCNEGGWFGPSPYTFNKNREVDDASLACICRFRKLKELDLNSTNIGDPGILHVATLPELELLVLDYTDVSDSSVPLLKRLVKLKRLYARKTRISATAIADLKESCPQLAIFE